VATYVDPRAQAAFYRQNKLGSILSGEGIHPDVAIGGATADDDDNQDYRDTFFQNALQGTSQASSNQTALYAQAVQKKAQEAEEARQKKYMEQQLAKIAKAAASNVPTYTGSSGSAGKGLSNSSKTLVGKYELTPAASAAYNSLAAAYKKAGFGNLSVISGGRTYAEQQRLYQMYLNGTGNLAAKPGTSVHESGRAVDFGGAAHGYGAAHNWLVANAGKYGWVWTGKNFSQVEPWHFEFTG